MYFIIGICKCMISLIGRSSRLGKALQMRSRSLELRLGALQKLGSFSGGDSSVDD